MHCAQYLALVDATSQYREHAQPILDMSPEGACLRIQVPSSALAQGEMFDSWREVTVRVTVFVIRLNLTARIEVGETRLSSFLRRGISVSEAIRVSLEETVSNVKAWRCGRGSSSESG